MIVGLKPVHTKQKSFYGKAVIEICDDILTLYSYNVRICKIVNGKFCRFRMQNDFQKLNKKEWLKMEMEA